MMSVCTLADIKDRLGYQTSNTEYDTMLNQMIAAMVDLFDRYTNRCLIVTDDAVTEYRTGLGYDIQLSRYPVVSITTIKESYDYDWDNATALTADTDYRLINSGNTGIISRLYGTWPAVPDSVQLVYRGGYAAAGETPGDGETALPDDIREAAIMQASFIFKRRLDIGLSGQSFDGGSINKFAPMDLLPMVKNILSSYKRITL